MSIKRDLQNAATLLREMGWTPAPKGKGWNSLGAIQDVTRSMGRYLDARDAFTEHMRGWDAARAWEDAPGRTAEEVIAALEAAAEAAK